MQVCSSQQEQDLDSARKWAYVVTRCVVTLLQSKMVFYEGSVHIPMIMRLPGVIQAGKALGLSGASTQAAIWYAQVYSTTGKVYGADGEIDIVRHLRELEVSYV